jgi:hypothetical protein
MFNKFPIRMGLIIIFSFGIPTDANTVYPINPTGQSQYKCYRKQYGCDNFTHRYNSNTALANEAHKAYLQMSA